MFKSAIVAATSVAVAQAWKPEPKKVVKVAPKVSYAHGYGAEKSYAHGGAVAYGGASGRQYAAIDAVEPKPYGKISKVSLGRAYSSGLGDGRVAYAKNGVNHKSYGEKGSYGGAVAYGAGRSYGGRAIRGIRSAPRYAGYGGRLGGYGGYGGRLGGYGGRLGGYGGRLGGYGGHGYGRGLGYAHGGGAREGYEYGEKAAAAKGGVARFSAIDVPEKKPYGKIARVGVIDEDAYAKKDAAAYGRYGSRVGGGSIGAHGIRGGYARDGGAYYGAAAAKKGVNQRTYVVEDDIQDNKKGDVYSDKAKVVASKRSYSDAGAAAYGANRHYDLGHMAHASFRKPHVVVHKKHAPVKKHASAPAKDVFGGMRSGFGGVGRRFDGDVRGSYHLNDFDNALAW